MTIDETINNFLRDAQYRIAQYSIRMNEIKDDSSYQYKECFQQRLRLIIFMSILFEGKWYIQDGYNHIQYGDTEETWTENQITLEIEYLRYYTNMNEVPYITFTAHYPQIASYLGTGQVGSGTDIPSGNNKDILFFNEVGQLYADSIDPWAGVFTNETITGYFEGRA